MTKKTIYEQYPHWKCLSTKRARQYLQLDDKTPFKIRELERKCFVCGKKHITCGELLIFKLTSWEDKPNKILHIFTRTAPISCFLAHRKKFLLKLWGAKISKP
jgi:hypothetical protein